MDKKFQCYDVVVTPEYGNKWYGIVYREYNKGEVLVIHPIDDKDPVSVIYVDNIFTKRIEN